VGCVLALRCPDLPSLAARERAESWLVQGLFVAPDRRDEGWGDRLLEAIETAARDDGIRIIREDAR
jgi:GNAT superfamily N-acetyltransferase